MNAVVTRQSQNKARQLIKRLAPKPLWQIAERTAHSVLHPPPQPSPNH